MGKHLAAGDLGLAAFVGLLEMALADGVGAKVLVVRAVIVVEAAEDAHVVCMGPCAV